MTTATDAAHTSSYQRQRTAATSAPSDKETKNPRPDLHKLAAQVSDPIQEEEDDDDADEMPPNVSELLAGGNDNNNSTDNLNKLTLLRNLLVIERERNEQRSANNKALQKYLGELQTDYLRLQRELLDALELGHKVRDQKEAQLETLAATLDERERLVTQLREKLDSLDEQRLRDEFKALAAKQAELAELEREQVRQQVVSLEQQLVCERVNNSQLLQQLQSKLEVHVQAQARAERELEQVLGEPKNLALRALREDKCKLEGQVEEQSQLLEQSGARFDALRKRMESLLEEQEQVERRNEDELERMSEALRVAERRAVEVKLELEDREEVVQILQFNLQRSERRIKNLLVSLKGKEAAYKELIGQLELRHEEELEKVRGSAKASERKALEQGNELDRKQNEIMRLQLEHESQLESLRNDRDFRLDKLGQTKQKAERGMQVAEMKVAQLIEELDRKNELIAQHQKEANQFREEARRLSIELTKKEAILYGKQKEMNEMIRSLSSNNLRQLDDKSFELTAADERAKRLEQVAGELRRDNEKLSMKLRISEQKLSQVGAAISKEQAKMVFEYEKKMHQIREEQSIFDKNKLRYKRYGYKLKKYCEHLRRVHEHLCNPSLCGYSIIPTKSSAEPLSRDDNDNAKSTHLISSDDDDENNNEIGHYDARTNESNQEKENLVMESSAGHAPLRRKCRFSIKRTSTVGSGSARRALSILKSSQSSINPLYQDSSNASSDHKYYCIDDLYANDKATN